MEEDNRNKNPKPPQVPLLGLIPVSIPESPLLAVYPSGFFFFFFWHLLVCVCICIYVFWLVEPSFKPTFPGIPELSCESGVPNGGSFSAACSRRLIRPASVKDWD